MKRLKVAPILLLIACSDLHDPTATQLVRPSFSVLQTGCDVGSLIGAINAANGGMVDTIELAPACSYQLTNVFNTGVGFGSNGLPLITRSMTINGNGATIERSPGAPEFRFFYILNIGAVSVTLNDLTLSGGAYSDDGGALVNEGATVTLNHVTLSGNVAGDDGGALHNAFGTVHLNSSTVSNNHAQDWGGGLSNHGGTLNVHHSTISENLADDYGGGIVNVDGTVNINGASVISGNTAGDDGGGVSNYGVNSTDINRTRVNVESSTISGNTAQDDGGGLANAAGVVTIRHSVISANISNDAGGGVRNENGGHLRLENSTVSYNQGKEDGGGLHNVDAAVTVIASTFEGNHAKWGGGIANEGGDDQLGGEIGKIDGSILIVNSTLSANVAEEGGGGLFNDFGGAFTLAHSTVTRNSAPLKGGGGVSSFNDLSAQSNVKGSIIAGNSPDDLGALDLKTRYTSLGHNVVGTARPYADLFQDFSAVGDQHVFDPMLGPLADNGGPTQTHALLSGSPARDTGGPQCPPTDQRGGTRPAGIACDVGAVEANASIPNPGPNPDPDPDPDPGPGDPGPINDPWVGGGSGSGTVVSDPWGSGPVVSDPWGSGTVVDDPWGDDDDDPLGGGQTKVLATDAWDEANHTTLGQQGRTAVIQNADLSSLEVFPGHLVVVAFGQIPANASVASVKLHVTLYAEPFFTGDAGLQIGGGHLLSPSPYAAMATHPQPFPTELVWDITAWVHTVDRVNDLKLIVRNLDPMGKKLFIDQAYIEIGH